jgi:hypothetical protein
MELPSCAWRLTFRVSSVDAWGTTAGIVKLLLPPRQAGGTPMTLDGDPEFTAAIRRRKRRSRGAAHSPTPPKAGSSPTRPSQPIRCIPQRDAQFAKEIGFLLQPAGVGEHRAVCQGWHLRLSDHADPGRGTLSGFANPASGL